MNENSNLISGIARNIYKSVVSGILNLLEQDIFYCDLKPGNLLYSYSDDINNLRNITSEDDILSNMSIYFGDIGGIVFTYQFFDKNKISPSADSFSQDRSIAWTFSFLDEKGQGRAGDDYNYLEAYPYRNTTSIFNNNQENKKFILNFIHQIFAFRYFCLVDKLTDTADLYNIFRNSVQEVKKKESSFLDTFDNTKDKEAFRSIYFPDRTITDQPVLKLGNFQINFEGPDTPKKYESNKLVIQRILLLLLRYKDD